MSGNERKKRNYKVDFFVVTHKGEREHTVMSDLFNTDATFLEARQLTAGEDERHQVRSIIPSKGKKRVFSGIFGRCRYGEKPVQGTDNGDEDEVELKPGHGLVEKNHFMFFEDRNLLLYQRNGSGSHHAKLQRYIGDLSGTNVQLEPILTTDAYSRLLRDETVARAIDLSFQKPKDPSLYPDSWTQEAIELINNAGGISAKIRISVGRSKESLLDKMKGIVVRLARGGIARVARVNVEGEDAPIDLIADRVIETISVELDDNGRPRVEHVFSELRSAADRRQKDLKGFFGH